VEDGLRIGVARHEDAECVSDALKEYGSEIEDDHGAFAVVIPTAVEGEMFTALLSALKACLDENEIPSVSVTLGEQSYVMEGTTG
jgi:hypothetical protein